MNCLDFFIYIFLLCNGISQASVEWHTGTESSNKKNTYIFVNYITNSKLKQKIFFIKWINVIDLGFWLNNLWVFWRGRWTPDIPPAELNVLHERKYDNYPSFKIVDSVFLKQSVWYSVLILF